MTITIHSHIRAARIALLVLVVLAMSLAVVPRAAGAQSAWWQLSTIARPTYVQPGGEATLVIQAVNMGDAGVFSANVPVTISDTLPTGMNATAISATAGADVPGESPDGEPECQLTPTLNCTWSSEKPLQPYEQIEIDITVKVDKEATSGKNEVSVEGGLDNVCEVVRGTGQFSKPFCSPKHEGESESHTGDYERVPGAAVPPRSLSRTVIVKAGPTPFGIADYGLAPEEEGGALDTQAGSHPYQLTTTLAFNEAGYPFKEGESVEHPTPALPRDLSFDLPAGLVGNATAIPRCSESEFFALRSENSDLCPDDTVVGVAMVTMRYALGSSLSGAPPDTFAEPVFNLVTDPGEPARFGFLVEKAPIVIDTAVRTGRDYGIVATVSNVSEQIAFLSSRVTLWGVPGDPRHDIARGWSCVSGGHFAEFLPPCTALNESNPPPFLTVPTSCSGELQTSMQADAWNGAQSAPPLSQEPMESLSGCERLPFSAAVTATPDVREASKPTGFSVDIHVPQEASLNGGGIAGADVKDTAVTLPAGVALNPAGADGLQACGEAQIGFEGVEASSGTDLFSPTLGSPFCSDASKVGEVSIETPLLANPLKGSIYLAAQDANPFGSLVAMYIVAEDPVSGVLVKLPGKVSLDPVTGRITATFEDTPQVPFEELEAHFFGGERAPLATPAHCGTYMTEASFTPWSGNAPVVSLASFSIDSGPDGSPCPSATLPFTPSLTGGSTNVQAGGFSPFTTTISRADGQQDIRAVQLHMPAGISGVLSGVKLCGEAQADAGTCGPESQIGSTVVSVGLGGDPFSVTGGKVYLTGSYEGAPFGLSIVNPAVAGPFDLGVVVVRAKIQVDPHTAALTITTDNSGSYGIPHILDGIPLQIKHVNVTIERPGFTFNPTDCDPTAITGSVTSAEGASSAVSVPFQVTNCAALKFTPKFTVATSGRTSRADGASLKVKLTYPSAPQGTQANIASVKVELPRQLPSRLTTLQKACTAAQFEADPAGCPAASIVGHARATTPILPVPLEGPAYFVSHGGEAFPSLIVVLQGYGVTVDLVGTTHISKQGITSSTFASVPDVPVGTFELNLPEGPYSALAANGELCRAKLAMPTVFKAQDGVELRRSVPIEVGGCSDTLAILAHRVRTNAVSAKLYVPAAGELRASGRGLSQVAKSVAGRQVLTVGLSRKRAGALRTRVLFVFTPAAGRQRRKQTASLDVRFAR